MAATLLEDSKTQADGLGYNRECGHEYTDDAVFYPPSDHTFDEDALCPECWSGQKVTGDDRIYYFCQIHKSEIIHTPQECRG